MSVGREVVRSSRRMRAHQNLAGLEANLGGQKEVAGSGAGHGGDQAAGQSALPEGIIDAH